MSSSFSWDLRAHVFDTHSMIPASYTSPGRPSGDAPYDRHEGPSRGEGVSCEAAVRGDAERPVYVVEGRAEARLAETSERAQLTRSGDATPPSLLPPLTPAQT